MIENRKFSINSKEKDIIDTNYLTLGELSGPTAPPILNKDGLLKSPKSPQAILDNLNSQGSLGVISNGTRSISTEYRRKQDHHRS